VGLEVTSAESTLAHHALRHRVEGDQLNSVAVGLTKVVHGLSHGDELGAVLVDVSLVDLVRQDENAMLVADFDDVLEVL